jgi:hypothetical protein
MCPLRDTNWVFISQKTAFFIVTDLKTSNLPNAAMFIGLEYNTAITTRSVPSSEM